MRMRLRNAVILDGSGAPPFTGDLLVEDEYIAEVGEVSGPCDETLDLAGAALAPGFIDVHSHSDFTLPGDPEAQAKTLQGVTTEVVCNCGLGLMPANDQVSRFYDRLGPMIFGEPSGGCFRDLDAFRDALHERGVSVNVACLVPHGNVRCAVMGMAERSPSSVELDHMRSLVAEGMAQGAFGMSSGLVYPPGAYAGTEELAELAKELRTSTGEGIYTTHLRDEGAGLLAALDEAIRIGHEARVGVQISHHKAAGRVNWGKTRKSLARIERARAAGVDVHSDVYPYTAGSTVLSAMFLPLWVFEGSPEQMLDRLRDPSMRARIIAEAKARLLTFAKLPGALDRWVPKKALLPLLLRELSKVIVISSTRTQHHLEGMTLRQVAKSRKQPLFDAMIDLLVEEDTAVSAIAHVMDEEDVRRVLRHPFTMVGTDGFPQREGKPHPRTHGTYPRILERYVRELGLLRLEEAVHKMTGMVAEKLGLRERGLLRPGLRADLVIFSPAEVHDRATYETPRRPPRGIAHVFVNGEWTVRDGVHTGARAGKVLRRR